MENGKTETGKVFGFGMGNIGCLVTFYGQDLNYYYHSWYYHRPWSYHNDYGRNIYGSRSERQVILT